MKLTPQLQIPYLEPADAANVPLYLQRLAEKVEAEAGQVDDAVAEAAMRPYAIWSNPLGVSVAAAPDFETVFGLGDPILIASNYAAAADILPGHAPFNMAGVWHCSWSFELEAAGSITAKSARSVIVNVVRLAGDHYEVVQDLSQRGVLETDTQQGATQLAGEGLFLVGDDFATTYLSMTFQHSNAASVVSCNPGGRVAVRMVGTDDVIEVV